MPEFGGMPAAVQPSPYFAAPPSEIPNIGPAPSAVQPSPYFSSPAAEFQAIQSIRQAEAGPFTAPPLRAAMAPAEEPVRIDTLNEADAMIEAAIAADEDVAGIMRMNDVRRSVAVMTAASSAETAAVTQLMEMDITDLINVMDRVNAAKEKQNQLSLTALYVKTIALCIREKDRFRMRLSKARNAYLLMDGAHIGLQIGVGDGFVTPVIKDADVKPIEGIAAEVSELIDKAKRGGVSESDCRGAAITLLDKGESGIYAFTPIIKQPESAILGIGAPYQRLIMTDKSIENRYFVMQSLTFDHRVITGNEADDFQAMLKGILEEPGTIFR